MRVLGATCGRRTPTRSSPPMARRCPSQLELPVPLAWGGARPGAGRPSTMKSPGPAHVRRPPHDPRHPVHVTLRARPSVPSLRSERMFARVRDAIRASGRSAFRVLHFSIQTDHLHLIVEADRPRALANGLRGLVIRCALAINRAASTSGPVWRHRYHTHVLSTPSEVRRAIAYVLLNFRKHLRASPGIDPRSSGAAFDGWAGAPDGPAFYGPVARPRTWLGAIGWRRAGGPIALDEAPSKTVNLNRR
jgi:putative transposase